MSRNTPEKTFELTPRPGSAGTGLVDVLLAMSVIIAAALTAFHLTVSTVATGAANERLNAARLIMRRAMSDLEHRSFEDVFLAFNEDPSDDPDGPNSSPGAETLYEVVRNGADDGLQIRRFNGASEDSHPAGLFKVIVEFPTTSDGFLSETRSDFLQGFTPDLNRDGHAGDSHLRVTEVDVLPLRLRVVWEGASGTESLEMARVLSRR